MKNEMYIISDGVLFVKNHSNCPRWRMFEHVPYAIHHDVPGERMVVLADGRRMRENSSGWVVPYMRTLPLLECLPVITPSIWGESPRVMFEGQVISKSCLFLYYGQVCRRGDYVTGVYRQREDEAFLRGSVCQGFDAAGNRVWMPNQYARSFEGSYYHCYDCTHVIDLGHVPLLIIQSDDRFMEVEGTWYRRDSLECCEGCGVLVHPLATDKESFGCTCMPTDLRDYHGTPSPRFKGFPEGVTYPSIGFEVEKIDDGEYYSVGDTLDSPKNKFLTGWETDSSCGIEGISHIYYLKNYPKFKADLSTAAFIDQLEANGSCGGHITLAGGKLTNDSIRRYAGLLYALYRHRLVNNEYCYLDKKVTNGADKYCVIHKRWENCFEFRLVSAVHSRSQLDWRFRFFALFYEAMEKGWSFRGYFDRNRKLLKEVYRTPMMMRIRKLAFAFDDYLQNRNFSREVWHYVRSEESPNYRFDSVTNMMVSV